MFLRIIAMLRGVLTNESRTRSSFVYALLIALMASASTMGSLVLFKVLIDNFFLSKADLTSGLQWIGLYLALQMLGRFLSDYGFLAYGRFEQGAQRALGHYVFRRLHDLSLRVYQDQHLGSLAHIVDHGFSGFRTISYSFFIGMLPLIFDVVFVLGLFYALYGCLFVGISLAFVGLYILLTQKFAQTIDSQQQTYMAHSRAAFGKCFDSLLNYETVKYFGNEDLVAWEFHDELSKLEQTSLKMIQTSSWLGYAQSTLTAVFMAGLLVILGTRVSRHELQLGDLVMVNLYMLQLMRPLSLAGGNFRAMKNAAFDLEALRMLLSQTSDIVDMPNALPLQEIPDIQFKGVSFAHRSNQSVFKELNLTIRKGERIALVGSSGSGKTTLTRLLFRLYDPGSGEILINGQNLRTYSLSSLRERLSIVPQEVVLFNDTLLRNLQFGNPAATQSHVENAVRQAGLEVFIKSLPDAYDTLVGERGMKLSGGERQRVGIARAILKNPDLYLFDEATSSLDTQTEKEIQKNLFKISEGKTALIIAHRLSTVVDCDRILVMKDGKIIEEGTHEILLRAGNLYASLWKAQSRGE